MDAQVNAVEWAQISNYQETNKIAIKKSKRPISVFIGNSITEGWVNAMPEFFTSNNFVGRGISSQTSSQVLLRFRQDVVDLKPTIVIISIGTNDVAENTGPYIEDFTVNNITAMIEIAQSNKIQVILASVLPASSFHWRMEVEGVGNKIISLNKRLKELCTEKRCSYLDYHLALKNKVNGLSPEYAEDGVHPTLKCYQKMAELAQKMIEKEIKGK